MAEKRIVYFTDSYNTDNPPAGVEFIDPAKTLNTEISISNLESIVFDLNQEINALKADVLVLKTDAAGGVLEEDGTITVTNITGGTVGNGTQEITILKTENPISTNTIINGTSVTIKSATVDSGLLNITRY